MSTYSINASEIAALAGMNPYQKQDEAIERFRMRVDRKRFMNELRAKEEDPVWLKAQKLCADDRFKEIVHVATNKSTRNTAELTAKKVDLAKNLQSLGAKVTETERKLVHKEVISKANTVFGTELENKVRERWSRDTGKDVRRDDSTQSKELFTLSGHCFRLRGKVDGIVEDDSNSVLEIKTRTKRLFCTVREYERVQVQAYCFLMDCEKAYLVEALKTEDDFEMEWTEIDRDEDFWISVQEEVIHALHPYFI